LSSSEIQRPIVPKGARARVRVLHSSDLHGNIASLWSRTDPFDVWLDTGDFFPNLTADGGEVDPVRETDFQREWIRDDLPKLLSWLNGRPALSMPGNHDYLELSEVLHQAGADARRIDPSGVDCAGLRWAGFREVKWMDGRWNGECLDFTKRIAETFARPPDVLVTHAPPAGVLDSELDFGIASLADAVRVASGIRAHFFGHDHRRGGEWADAWGTRFFNGAKTVHVREVIPDALSQVPD